MRVVGQAALAAMVYALERLRCNACGQVYTAEEPEGVGPDKYDEIAAAMITQLKVWQRHSVLSVGESRAPTGHSLAGRHSVGNRGGSGGGDQAGAGVSSLFITSPVPPDGSVLRREREPSDERTGVFTSGIVSAGEGDHIALYFTGREHAGENLADVLAERAAELPAALQMCDALSRNMPKLNAGAQILLANCMAHGRRQFLEVAPNFPDECRYVLEILGRVYGVDAEAHEHRLMPQQRLELHRQRSAPVMEELHRWLERQFAERRTGPNSGLGKAITYLLRHWRPLTLFLREPRSRRQQYRREGIKASGIASQTHCSTAR